MRRDNAIRAWGAVTRAGPAAVALQQSDGIAPARASSVS